MVVMPTTYPNLIDGRQVESSDRNTNINPSDTSDVIGEFARASRNDLDVAQTTFFVSRTTVVPVAAGGGMACWRKRLFAVMARMAGDMVRYFNLPADRVVELGVRVEI